MDKLNHFIEKFTKQYGGKVKLEPQQVVEKECFSYKREKGSWRIDFSSSLDGAFALSQFDLYQRGEKEMELEGAQSSFFKKRILWPSAVRVFSLNENWSLSLPEALCSGESLLFCQRLVEMGYNGVILGSHSTDEAISKPAEKTLKEIFSALSSCGLQIFIKPQCKGGKVSLQSYFSETLPSLGSIAKDFDFLSGVVWESLSLEGLFKRREELREFTYQDLILKELSALEASLPHGIDLFFMLNGKAPNTAWMQALLREASSQTSVLFSSEVEKGAPNSIWNELKAKASLSFTPMLPIVNAGNLGRGEGLWPLIDFEEINRALEAMDQEHFSGGIALCGHIPARGSYLDCLLWLFGSALRGMGSIQDLMEAHICAFHKGWPKEAFEVMKELARTYRDIHLLDEKIEEGARPEVLRSLAEAILGRLSWRQFQFSYSEPQGAQDFSVALGCAIRDMKRSVFAYLQKGGVNMPSVLNGEDLKPSFWTVVDQSPGKGIGSGAKVSLLKEPSCPEEDSMLKELFETNRNYSLEKSPC